MAQVELAVQKRTSLTKGANNALRRDGVIPAVVYHRGDESKAVAVKGKDFNEVLDTEAGRNALINLKVEGEKATGKPTVVVIKDIHYDALSGIPLHVDFHQISLTEKIKLHIPIHEKGDAIGVRSEGGILETHLRKLEIECLPLDIPEQVQIDISNLKLNEAIHVRDLKIPANVTVISDADAVVVQVVPPYVEEAKVEGAEGTAAEPEVINQKKVEEGEEGAAAAKPGEKKPAAAAEKKPEKK